MSLRIYIAGASSEPERVRRWMNAARAQGWYLTLDWLALVDAQGTANAGMCDEDRESAAAADWRAVREADVIWVLAPERASIGAWVELGMAIALGKRIVLSGSTRERTIFGALGAEYSTDELAFEALRRAVRS